MVQAWLVCLKKMVEIVLGAVGAEGLGNIPIEEEFGTNFLENGCQIRIQ